MALRRWVANYLSLTACFAVAQFPPTPEGIATKQVAGHPGVSISYKETNICETKAKAWSGYVHMPISYLHNIETADPYNVSMFFWYFEARENPKNAPTAIYLAGGPGESSMFGATSDGGPCNINADSNSTDSNPYSWNTYVNMLYIDQPVGAGFSYDVLIKGTRNLLFDGSPATETGITPFDKYDGKIPPQNTTLLYGVFPSQNPQHTANTTGTAAVTLWHFAQAWFSDFPEWKTTNKRVSIWGNSYGGYWVPASGAYFQQQNMRIKSGRISGTIIDLDTIGITNGCVDMLYQAEWYPQMAYNNTYGLQLIPEKIYEESLKAYSAPNGCRDLILKCRKLASEYDPQDLGINSTVNAICNKGVNACLNQIGLASSEYSIKPARSVFDISHLLPDPLPSYTIGFFNQGWVQKELGVPVNFTDDSWVIEDTVLGLTGDPVRRAGMKDLEYLLDSGVKVTLIYGDRDQRCPWLGAENLSLEARWTGTEKFRAAGYEYIHTNASYNGGVVRQHGNLSFSRVFEAGHDVSAYQPETTLQIFNRAMFDKDVATGNQSTCGHSNDYSSHGPSSSYGIKNKLPSPPPVNCYLWCFATSCTQDQLKAVKNGTAEIVDFRVVKPAGGGGPLSGSGGTVGNGGF